MKKHFAIFRSTRIFSLILVTIVAGATATMAQDKPAAPAPPANPLSGSAKRQYTQFKNFIVGSAEKMPEESYGFKPADTVRTYGQLVGHVADAQYIFCSAVRGEKNPDLKIETSKTSKADLVAALREAFTYCDKAYDGMTDTTGVEMIKFFGNDSPKMGVLFFNNMHNSEHYGNLVTYLRIKGIVPPSSEPRPAAAPTPTPTPAPVKKQD